MATMTVRTTVAFDPTTAARLERLAKRWGISKSETLRRALEAAERSQPALQGAVPDFTQMLPLQILDWLKANPQVQPGWGAESRRQLREARERDAQIEDEREQEKIRLTQTPTTDPNP